MSQPETIREPFATYTRYTNYARGERPTSIVVKAISTGGHIGDDLLATRGIGPCIIEELHYRMMVYNYWNRVFVNQAISGYLSASNYVNGTLKVYKKKINSVSELRDGRIFEEVIEDIQESNLDVTITDLEWTFSIDPASLLVGSGGKVVRPSWAPKIKFARTWEEHEGVACAAYALVYLTKAEERNYRHCPDRALDDAKELMKEMNWGVTVSATQLEKFVKTYPQYRLSVFTPHTIGKFVMSWVGEEYDGTQEKALYLVYSGTIGKGGHFAATKSPAEILKAANKKLYIRFCHPCAEAYNSSSNHECPSGGRIHKAKRPKKIPCPKGCGDRGAGHDCSRVNCRWCPDLKYEKENGWDHRCILYKEDKEKTFTVGDKEGKNPNLWAYDLEARVEIQETNVKRIVSFRTNPEDDTAFVDAQFPCDVAIYDFHQAVQKANMVVAKNIFTDELKIWEGDNSLESFLLFMLSYNGGNNILIAHNGSGYDTRLVYDTAVKLTEKISIHSVSRGTKFMELKVGKCIFRDSLLHVKGSIKSLAKSFCPGHLRKGYFPHLFNTSENYDSNYSGRIPHPKYFDLSMSCKNEGDRKEFNEWYQKWVDLYDANSHLPDSENPGTWNFRNEMRLYCINDVECLAMIAKGILNN